MAPEPLDRIFPGSWINANFDVWIGAEEDNQAWTQLLRARQTYDAGHQRRPEAQRQMAFEELLIAEGSDWCWWYGPEHDSANRPEFDQLYRSHLANVYRFLNLIAARGAFAAHPARDRAGGACAALGTDQPGDRRRGDFVFRMDRRGSLSRG